MPWIQNVALSDIKKGHHINPGEKAIDWSNDNEKVFTLAAERRARRKLEEGDI